MNKATVGFALAVCALGVLAYRHFAPALSHVDSSAYALPEGEAPADAALVGPLRIQVNGHDLEGGTGTLVNFKTTTLILTAKHLFDAGALSEPSPADLTRDVKEVTLKTAKGASYTSTRALYLAGTESSTDEPSSVSRDVAAMLVETPARGLVLATTPPKVGDPLVIVASDGAEVPVHVTESSATRLAYHFDDRVLGPGSSGAPILDDRGAVVGIHLRYGEHDGAGNPASSITKLLEAQIR